jgi:cytochrome o ubiquinol oxidase subunit 1
MFGRLTWESIPFHQPIPLITSLVVMVVLAAVAVWVHRMKAWGYLWNEWFTSTDH